MKPLASLSLDLDNAWSYLKTHGDEGWESFPSYLDVAVPRLLDLARRRGQRLTVFVVGQDAALPQNAKAMRLLGESGHELGNHSFHHEPWLHLYEPAAVEAEIALAEEAIASATGQRPRGFRGPGFSLSPAVLEVLRGRGYLYDASTFPTFLGPLARAYYLMTASLTAEERARRRKLFGGWREGLRPVGPYRWNLAGGTLLELPVTTLPLLRVPIHLSYVLYLRGFSPALAKAYFEAAMTACRRLGVGPSLLLHPLDILSGDDAPRLAFFPGMALPLEQKLACVEACLDAMARRFDVRSMAEHATAMLERSDLRVIDAA